MFAWGLLLEYFNSVQHRVTGRHVAFVNFLKRWESAVVSLYASITTKDKIPHVREKSCGGRHVVVVCSRIRYEQI
jgi:hypothetical protein